MKRKGIGLLIASLTIFALMIGVVTINSSQAHILENKAQAIQYKLTIGNDGKNPDEQYRITSDEISAKSFKRQTQLGNDVSFALDTTGHFATNANNLFLQYGHGSFWNTTPITGLKSIKITFNTNPLKIYYGNAIDSLPYYTEDLAVGTHTIDVSAAGDISYIKAVAGTGNVYVKFIEFTYSCEVSTNRGVLKTGTGAGGLYNAINLSRTYTVSEGGTINVDFKFIDPTITTNAFSIYLAEVSTHAFGNYKVQYDATYGYKLAYTSADYNGVSLAPLNDGYFRLTFDIATLCRSTNNTVTTAPTEISKVMFSWFNAEEGAYFDVEPTINVQYKIAGHYIIGLPVYSGNATLSFDLMITSGNKFWTRLMTETHGSYSADYKFDTNGINGSGSSDYVTATKLWNNMVHVEFSLGGFAGRITRLEDQAQNWTDGATGYIENLKIL